MFKLTKHQIESISITRWHDVSGRISKHLQDHFCALLRHQSVDQPFLEKELLPTLQEANQWGFSTERDLRVYAEGCAVLGWRFLNDKHHDALVTAIKRAQSSEQKAKLVDQAIMLQQIQLYLYE